MAPVSPSESSLATWIAREEPAILAEWGAKLKESSGVGSIQLKDSELQSQSRAFLRAFRDGVASGEFADIEADAFSEVREFLADLSRSRALQGFTPKETATFVFSLKPPLSDLIRRHLAGKSEAAADLAWSMSTLIDQFALYVMEAFQRSREEVILRQQQEIAELSTPVVRLWEGVLALPLIGTLDSSRTQVVMENLLQAIVDQSAVIAIIDITGVPTVDTLVAQHLLKTIAAARLMGADCIISGIRPQIAQTMVHLGVELNVTSKASLSEAFALALKRTGRIVTSARKSEG